MIRFSQRQIPSLLNRRMALLFAIALGGMVSVKAGLVINAIAGDISNPSPNIIGGGNLATIFNQAVSNWELAYPDPVQEWTVTVTYQWADLGADQVAKFTLGTLDAETGRILSGTATFNNRDTEMISWFADPNPGIILGNPYFTAGTTVTNSLIDVGGEMVPYNIGIAFESAPGSPAFGRSDLLTISMHEIGHGLGLLFVEGVYEPPPQLIITEEGSAFYAGYEIFVYANEHLAWPSLMVDKTDLGTRFYPSANDILAMTTISGYSNPVLNPYNVPGVAVPVRNAGVSPAYLCIWCMANSRNVSLMA